MKTRFNYFFLHYYILWGRVIKYRREHNVSGTLWWVSFPGTLRWVPLQANVDAGDLELGKRLGLACSKNIMFSEMVCCGVGCFQLSRSIV